MSAFDAAHALFGAFRLVPDESGAARLTGYIMHEVPRSPTNHMRGEDWRTPRISVAPTIPAAVAGLVSGVTPSALKLKHYRRFNGYRIHGLHTLPRHLTNAEVARRVPDAARTGEMWILAPVDMDYVGHLTVRDGRVGLIRRHYTTWGANVFDPTYRGGFGHVEAR